MTDLAQLIAHRVEQLEEAAKRVPLGHECRSCGASTYNHLTRLANWLKGGEPCCAKFKLWLDPATPVAMSAAQKRALQAQQETSEDE